MSLLKEPTVSRSDFRRALNLKCHQVLGIGLNDLPDIINIDDVWYEGQEEKEAVIMINSCIKELQEA
jgi:hypothetical protein